MIFQIKKLPIGIQCAKAGFEAIDGLTVEGDQIGDEIVVKKTTIVEKLRDKGTACANLWAESWNRAINDTFRFAL